MARLPNLLIGLGGLILLAILGERFVIIGFGVTVEPIYLVFLGSSLPFLAALLVGGWWLDRGALPEERYRRIGGWTAVWIGFWGGLFLLVGLLSLPAEQIWGPSAVA